MSEQSQTTSETPAENKLCKMGCGFFGNNTTGGCCSKCWREMQKKNEAPAPVVQAPPAVICKPVAPVVVEEPTPMDVDPAPAVNEAEEKPAAVSTTTPKKKKKASYKNMMKGMMQSNSPSKDAEKEKDSIRKVTGGGTFSKIDKI